MLGKNNAEGAALRGDTVDLDSPAVLIADALDDCKPEPVATTQVLRAEKTLENARQVLDRDALAGVGDCQPFRRIAYPDEAALGVLDSIAYEISEDQPQRLVVQFELGFRRDVHFEHETLAFDLDAVRLDCFGNALGERDRLDFAERLAPGQEKQGLELFRHAA